MVHDQIILGQIRCDLVCLAQIVLNLLSPSVSLVLLTHLIECWRVHSHLGEFQQALGCAIY